MLMSEIHWVSELFAPSPAQWGLRGDPYLWQELSHELSDRTLPESAGELMVVLEAAFYRLVGEPVHTLKGSVFVARYSHGGMSSGHVAPDFWRNTALPLLRSRFTLARPPFQSA